MDKHFQQITQGQVFLIGFAYLIVLRVLSGLLGLLIVSMEPALGKPLEEVTAIVPLPVLVMVVPFLLAALIIFFSRPRHQRLLPARPPATADPDDDQALFQPYYSREQLFGILKIITVIWVVIFLTRMMLWFAFRSYG